MQKSTLLKTFNTLTKKNIRELRKFVRSPFFNQRADVIALFDYLAIAKKDPSQNLQKEFVFSKILPGQPYDDHRMRLAMYFLLKQINHYLSYTEFFADEVSEKVHLCRAFRQRGLEKQFEKTLSAAQKQHRQSPLRNIQHHYQNYQLHLERYAFDHQQRRSGQMNLQELSDELTTFYLADILRHSCTILTHQRMSGQDYHQPFLEKVLEEVERGAYEDIPAVAVYYHAYRALREKSGEAHFQSLRQLITTHWQAFPPSEIRDIYLLAINYCIRQLNRGEKQFIREAFELYRPGLAQGILLEEGILSKFTYNNVMMLGLALEGWEWVAHFLEEYKSLLPRKERENIYRYNQAIYHFRKPDYGKAMQLLQRVEFRDVQYNLNARRMLLRMYYELGEYEALESLLDSFRTFIHRRKDLGYHRDHYLNLIRFVRKILRHHPNDPDFMGKVRSEVEEAEALAEKAWLLEQLG